MKHIPIAGTDKEATDFRQTPTGPIALIKGFWYSVNGNENEIVDVRFKLAPQPEIQPL